MQVQSLHQEDPLAKEMTIHSSWYRWTKSHGQRSLAGYTIHGFTKSWTWLKQLNMHAYI